MKYTRLLLVGCLASIGLLFSSIGHSTTAYIDIKNKGVTFKNLTYSYSNMDHIKVGYESPGPNNSRVITLRTTNTIRWGKVTITLKAEPKKKSGSALNCSVTFNVPPIIFYHVKSTGLKGQCGSNESVKSFRNDRRAISKIQIN